MAQLLYVTNGLSGGLNASYELARRMEAAGHSVRFLGHADLATKVEAQGYDYTRVGRADAAMAELRDSIGSVGPIRSLPRAYKLRREIITSREIETAVAEHAPDGLIIDIEAHYCVLATRSLGIPTVIKSDWFSMLWQRGIPPLHSDLPMPNSWSERRQADARWLHAQAGRVVLNTIGELHPARLARRYAPFRYNTVSRRDLRAVARSRDLGLRGLTSQHRHLLRPHVYPNLPMVSSVATELDFITQSEANDHAIGPLVFRDRVDSATSADERTRWNEFRNRNRASNRPLIYCSFGTVITDTSTMLQRVVSAVRAQGDWDLVVGLGGRDEALESVADPNVLVLTYAPQLEILSHADAAIAHGGVNTINECVTFGVPMVLERRGDTDQPGNASRVEHYGLGVRADLATIAVPDLQKLIDRVLNDTAMRDRVEKMRARFQRYEDDQVAERTIERLLDIDPV